MNPLTRRQFLLRLGGTAVSAAAMTAMPDLLRLKGWYDPAFAQEVDVVLDTFNGVAAFVWPGDDDYSVAQGESADRPGALAADAGRHIREALDIFVPAPDDAGANDETLPLSGAIASGINSVALTVNPLAAGGAFLSPFARLTFAEKAETWRVLEEDTQSISTSDLPEPYQDAGNVLQFVFGVLPGFVQFFAFAEIDVIDPASRTLTQRPVGWDHTGYQGDRQVPVEGWDEFKGFYQGRSAVNGSDGTGEVVS